MKYSTFTVIMPEFTIEEAINELKSLGYDGVEWRVAPVEKQPLTIPFDYWHNNKCTVNLDTIKQDAEDIKQKCQSAGLEVSCLSTYLHLDKTEQIGRVMDAAGIMGCSLLRVCAPGYDRSLNYNQIYEQTLKKLAITEKMARQYKVKVCLEIHMGSIIPSASLAHRLVSKFNPEYVGIIYDPGNMVCEGYENWRMGLQLLGSYLAHVHVKNSKWVIKEKKKDGTVVWNAPWDTLKEGLVNWHQVVGDLRAVGYKGYLSSEDFSDLPTKEKLKQNIEFLKSLNK